MRKLPLPIFLMGFVLVALTACETQSTPPPAGRGYRESSIPWNRPAKWEGPGAMGGMAPVSQ